MSKLHPPIIWCQFKDTVSITAQVQDAENVKINLESSGTTSLLRLSMRGAPTSGGDVQDYSCEITLFASVKPALSQQQIKPRGVFLKLVKKDSNSEWFWPRLTSAKVKNQNIKIDFENWKDEDEILAGNAVDDAAGPLSSLMMGGGDHTGTGGMSLESDEVQRTLAALREEQLKLKEEEANLRKQELAVAKDQHDVNQTRTLLRQKLQELEDAKQQSELMKQAPAFGSASGGQSGGCDDDDDDDEMPPLVA